MILESDMVTGRGQSTCHQDNMQCQHPDNSKLRLYHDGGESIRHRHDDDDDDDG